MNRSKSNPLAVISFAANALLAVISLTALYVAQDVFIPLTLSTLLAFLLGPLADRLENWGLRRIPAVLVLAFVAFTILSIFLWVVGREATKLASNIPQYQSEIVSKVEGFSNVGAGTAKRLTQFVTAISEALRGNKRAAEREKPKATGPVDDLDTESARAVTKETEQAQEPLGSATNPVHTVSASSDRSPMETALGTASAVLNPLTNVGLVVVFTIFMLLSRDDLRDRLIRVLSGGRYIVTTKAIDEASRRISSYIVAQTIVNSLYGLCIGFGLWVIGVTLGGDQGFPNYALWGLLCTVLRFVPYLGPIIAGAFPVALSLIVFPGFSAFIATALLFTCIELLSNNVIEPWLYGSSTGMSPMAIIVAAVFWTWMWGPVGLLLAIPITSSLVVMGKYVPQLRPITVLLGDKTPLPPFVSFYQRLLADDATRAGKILEAAIAETDIETAADDVLLPTIRRIRKDRASEELGAPREHRLMQEITGMIDDVLARHCESQATAEPADSAKNDEKRRKNTTNRESTKSASNARNDTANSDGNAAVNVPLPTDAEVNSRNTESRATSANCAEKVSVAVRPVEAVAGQEADNAERHIAVVGCAAHHESEEPVLKLLAYCLGQQGIEMRWSGTKALPGDVERMIEASTPEVIVIAIVPPDGFIQARYLCAQLHKRLPSAQIIVAFFGKVRSYDATLIKLRQAGATYFTTSLSQTRVQVSSALNHGQQPETADVPGRLDKRIDIHSEPGKTHSKPDGGVYVTGEALAPTGIKPDSPRSRA